MIAVIAVRAGSQRIKNKNLQKLGELTLLEHKINTLLKVRAAGFIDSIVVNSDSEEMLKIGADAGIETQKRDAYFASSDCTNSEFHRHIGEVTKADDIFLAPVCSPFVTVATHITAIKYYHDKSFDSLTSVTDVKNHLWMGGHPLNYELDNVPNSQDLPDVVKLNYGVTIVKKEIMRALGRVVGDNPGFLKIDEKESIDIDTPFDLAIARGILNA